MKTAINEAISAYSIAGSRPELVGDEYFERLDHGSVLQLEE